MMDANKLRLWARTVVMLAAILLAVSLYRAQPAGMDLAVNERGLSFQFRVALLNIAFDIGQHCPESNSCGRLV
ncbi:hypothetical protein OF829_19555 [Sphingomonas sp. LB-2]|uniref:hypothetical protein n=1 Tax=Sphingomonas caeni TaxID=2984949 RepID=UPI002230EABB|nr:hypothetical protein [Sphingomonas caeni]MCW3849439.1 hypothetical protein [Sphingomonas caeni]